MIRLQQVDLQEQAVSCLWWGVKDPYVRLCAIEAYLAGDDMDSFDQDMEDDQPLDLSIRTGSHPAMRIVTPYVAGPKRFGQESPLCLIKDCECNNHGPSQGGPSVYGGGRYGPVAFEMNNHPPCNQSSETCEAVDRLGFNGHPMCYEHLVTEPDMRRRNLMESAWVTRSAYADGADVHRAEEINVRPTMGPTCGSFSPSVKYYRDEDQDPHYLLDLSNDRTTKGSHWKLSVDNEDSCRRGSIQTSSDGQSVRDLNRLSEAESRTHWRPFVDVPERGCSRGTGSARDYSVESMRSTTSTDLPLKSHSAVTSTAMSLGLRSLPNTVAANTTNSSAESISRNVCRSFASTVPLISSSSPGSQVLNTPGSLPVTRTPCTSMRVTRSPKTFHNEVVRAESEGRGCPFRRPQDGRRQLAVGKHVLQEKENIGNSTQEDDQPAAVGVKMPALDYLISKVLVERIDVPFKPCNAEIKKIYNGESKGRLRLVDLIELQVEESLKA